MKPTQFEASAFHFRPNGSAIKYSIANDWKILVWEIP